MTACALVFSVYVGCRQLGVNNTLRPLLLESPRTRVVPRVPLSCLAVRVSASTHTVMRPPLFGRSVDYASGLS